MPAVSKRTRRRELRALAKQQLWSELYGMPSKPRGQKASPGGVGMKNSGTVTGRYPSRMPEATRLSVPTPTKAIGSRLLALDIAHVEARLLLSDSGLVTIVLKIDIPSSEL